MNIRDIQRLLTAAGYYKAGIDGDYGLKSKEAVGKILDRHGLVFDEPRARVAAAQIILNAAGYEPGVIDGYPGHNTREAFNAWDYYQSHGKQETISSRDDDTEDSLPTKQAVAGKWPTQAKVRSFFGEPGSAICTAGKVELPVSFVIAWNTSQHITRYSCHEKVADALTSIHGEAFRHYGEREFRRLALDKFGGCYNFRKMRGGSSYSMHSWGIAVDLDPESNQLRWGRDRAKFAQSEYDAWWNIVENHGAVSLGRARNYDWMHFQFARL